MSRRGTSAVATLQEVVKAAKAAKDAAAGANTADPSGTPTDNAHHTASGNPNGPSTSAATASTADGDAIMIDDDPPAATPAGATKTGAGENGAGQSSFLIEGVTGHGVTEGTAVAGGGCTAAGGSTGGAAAPTSSLPMPPPPASVSKTPATSARSARKGATSRQVAPHVAASKAGLAITLLLLLKKYLREAYSLADDRVAAFLPTNTAQRKAEEKVSVQKNPEIQLLIPPARTLAAPLAPAGSQVQRELLAGLKHMLNEDAHNYRWGNVGSVSLGSLRV